MAAPSHLRLALLLSILIAVTANGLRKKEALEKSPRLATFPLIPDDSPEARRRRRNRRRRQLASEEGGEEEDENSPLVLLRDALYEGYGVHYVDLWVGCPPQRVTVIVDTGSSVTGFPCSGCHRCGGDADSAEEHVQYHTDALFQQDESTCFEPVSAPNDCLVGRWDHQGQTCSAAKHYSEGSSWEAFEAVDQVYTGGDHNQVTQSRVDNESFQLHFGCQHKVTGLFETQLADGIMGMYNSAASFWYQAYNKNAIEKRMFSLCFSEAGHVERTGTLAGAMVLGGTDTRLHQTEMVYAQQMSNDGKYVLHLEKLYLLSPQDGEMKEVKAEDFHKVQMFEEDLNNGSPGVILDSGTTATYLTQQLAHRFVTVFNSLVPEDIMQFSGSKLYPLTLQHLEQLPTLVFQMRAWTPGTDTITSTTQVPGMVGEDLDARHAGKSILVGMPPTHYMSRKEAEEDNSVDLNDPDAVGHYGMNIYFNKKKNKGGVLGANFMRGHDVLFDVENSRIGFAQSNCEYALVADDEEAG